MCGICGLVQVDPTAAVDQAELLAMRDAMIHRGPDDAGGFLAPGVALGSRRLSILDLTERGRMPMRTADGRYHIVYNGEVYNSAELRRNLERKGYSFRSRTDTEVVLYLYADEGPKMLHRLNGMFAIAIWDAQERMLFLARDRLGVKPLYYARWNGTFLFASEHKALFAAGLRPEFDATTWEELLCFRYVAGERTPFTGVRRLLPGHYLVWRDGSIRIQRWWCLAERARALQDDPPRDPTSWFRDTFDNAVKLRRISDVPVGVLLSGGLDSSSVAASLAAQSESAVDSFTVIFDEPGYDEGPTARVIAERWRLGYHELKVASSDLLSGLLQATWLSDEPLVHGNDLHLLAISAYAKPIVTVLLSGEGADETLGGYVRYRPLRYPALLQSARAVASRLSSVLPPNGRARKLERFLSLGSSDAFVLFNACDILPTDLDCLGIRHSLCFPYREAVLAEGKSLYPHEPCRQAMYADQHTFLCSILDRNDRMTMGASIECRVPFLDYRLVETLAALPTPNLIGHTRSKLLLRRAVGGRLPKAVLRKPKWGFGVPWAQHLRGVPELRELVASLASSPPVSNGPFDRAAVDRMALAFLAGDHRYDALVRQLLMVSLWYKVCVSSHVPRHRGAHTDELLGAAH
jgi:asparagine synthase (glutamine-hydrolysing)